MALFQNKQWAVMDDGINSVEPGAPYLYEIEASGLLNSADEYYAWPLQVAGKTWVDVSSFEQAFRKAIELLAGKYKGQVDQALLDATFREAHKHARMR
ncbi:MULTISPECIES: hypothetical protein [Bradyrhizobium]|jgi:hypothetical protein|uniref:hypothetical protein n=1 Tax=Bradyrhizobium TaxID=374 RepID=UPI0027151F04|nr:hypothetical protein [Bradyrhizobium elkanii]WLA46657.1 hypothetical protein QIH80_33655 [Bradyrhizobium elkanii]WLB83057.1 hypothetical protein QIH83_11070 [Bradyrhizobium elkanii]